MNIGSLVLVFICVAIGYVLEPVFFSGSETTPETPNADLVEKVAKTPELSKKTITSDQTPEIQVDLSKVLKEDFPELVTLKIPYELSDTASGVTMQLKQGATVKPLSLEEGKLVFQFKGLPVKGKIKVSDTNFKELVTPAMLKRLQNSSTKPEKKDVAIPPSPVEEVIEEPRAETTPIEEPVAPADSASANTDSIIALMKASVAAGKVTEFEANQVTDWKIGENVQIGGKSYQTGIATFTAQTVLGQQKNHAMALIENGVVVKWVWANKRQLEMR